MNHITEYKKRKKGEWDDRKRIKLWQDDNLCTCNYLGKTNQVTREQNKAFQWTYLGLLLDVEPLFFGVASVFFGFGFDWDVNVEGGFVCYIMD